MTFPAPQWTAYLTRPLAEREANGRKVDAVLQRDGVQAARDMMRALGMPMPPEELWSPVDELEASRADGSDEAWIREVAAQLGLSPAEIEEVVRPGDGHTDH